VVEWKYKIRKNEMENKLLIKIEGAEIRLELSHKDKIVGEDIWREDGNLSKNLLKRIDGLLSGNKLKINDIDPNIKVESDNESYTSARIAKVVARMMEYSLS
jgi:hypothetical protein